MVPGENIIIAQLQHIRLDRARKTRHKGTDYSLIRPGLQIQGVPGTQQNMVLIIRNAERKNLEGGTMAFWLRDPIKIPKGEFRDRNE